MSSAAKTCDLSESFLWQLDCDDFVWRFAERAQNWDDHAGDLDDAVTAEPWVDPDNPDERLDAAYRFGIAPEPAPLRAQPEAGGRSPLEAALRYAARGWFVFPCHPKTRAPLIPNGFKSATTDPAVITARWTRWPEALVGFWSGPSNIAVLDVDEKNGKHGLVEFIRLGSTPILPPVPTVRTPSGGWHFHFKMPEKRITSTVCNPANGLDWRGEGGYVILPTPGSDYRWDHWTYDNCVLKLPAPGLLPKPPARSRAAKPIQRAAGLSPYAEAALNSAERTILGAGPGTQEKTLIKECFSLGTLAGAGGIPEAFALEVLHDIASRIEDFDLTRPWSARQLHNKVTRSFAAGLANPREARHAG